MLSVQRWVFYALSGQDPRSMQGYLGFSPFMDPIRMAAMYPPNSRERYESQIKVTLVAPYLLKIKLMKIQAIFVVCHMQTVQLQISPVSVQSDQRSTLSAKLSIRVSLAGDSDTLRSDSVDAQVDLELHCMHMSYLHGIVKA